MSIVDDALPMDLGDGNHRAAWSEDVFDLFAPGDVIYTHTCVGGRRGLSRLDCTSGRFHTLISREPLHIEASVLCPECGDHGFIRDGRWVAA